MACQQRSCQVAGGDALGRLAGFRRDVYRCLWRRAGALFETMGAVLAAGPVPSLPYFNPAAGVRPAGRVPLRPYLSLEPVLRRGHGMVYQGLARGRIDKEALRELLVAWRPR